MENLNSNTKRLRDFIKESFLSRPLVEAFRVWKRLRWSLFKGGYRNRYKDYLHFEGRQRPIMLSCETVNTCTNDCVFCGYGKMEREKEVMPLSLFEKVLKDYSELGGGFLSLTPLLGDALMDDLLLERIKLTEKYDRITSVSFTTNGVIPKRLGDEELRYILEKLSRVSLSVYGLDDEEYHAMTGRDNRESVLENMRRIIRLTGDKEKIRFGFRFFKKYDEHDIESWMTENFDMVTPFNRTNSYFNWAGSVDTSAALPFDGQWVPVTENKEACFMPMLGRILSNGKVTFCHCDDSDSGENLCLGNIEKNTLAEIYDSEKIRELWDFRDVGLLPSVCKMCTFHKPLSNLPGNDFVFKIPLDFIGA